MKKISVLFCLLNFSYRMFPGAMKYEEKRMFPAAMKFFIFVKIHAGLVPKDLTTHTMHLKYLIITSHSRQK